MKYKRNTKWLDDIHHYETLEVKDSKGRLILPPGQRVDQDFSIPAPYDATITGNSYVATGAYENTKYTGTGDISPVIGISNFVYETIKNEKKRKQRNRLYLFPKRRRCVVSWRKSLFCNHSH